MAQVFFRQWPVVLKGLPAGLSVAVASRISPLWADRRQVNHLSPCGVGEHICSGGMTGEDQHLGCLGKGGEGLGCGPHQRPHPAPNAECLRCVSGPVSPATMSSLPLGSCRCRNQCPPHAPRPRGVEGWLNSQTKCNTGIKCCHGKCISAPHH